MGKLSRFKIPGYTERMEKINKGIEEIKDRYDRHVMESYPKIVEDSEGIAYWESPKFVKMKFKGITPQQGYIRTMDKFNKLHIARFIRCYIKDEYVVVEF